MSKKRVTSIDMEVGRRVKNARQAANISQIELAASTGISRQQIQNYEKGNDRISAGMLNAISHKLNVPINYFFDNLELPINAAIRQVFASQASCYFNAIRNPQMQVRVLKLFPFH